jgi:hypothetical protein
MQKPFKHTLSSDDRAAISSAFLATLSYCGSITLVCIVLAAASGHSTSDGPVARSNTIPDLTTSMPL